MGVFSYDTVPLAVRLEDGRFVIHYFMVKGRGSLLPKGALWEGAYQWKREPTDANIVENLNNSFQESPVVSWRRLSRDDIPADREFRNAWEDDGRAITHSIEKARVLKREIIRHARASKFAELDGQWMCAFAKGQMKEAEDVEAIRQVWRDAPADPRIDLAQDIDALKAIQLPE